MRATSTKGFTCWDPLAVMVYGQLSGAPSLREEGVKLPIYIFDKGYCDYTWRGHSRENVPDSSDCNRGTTPLGWRRRAETVLKAALGAGLLLLQTEAGAGFDPPLFYEISGTDPTDIAVGAIDGDALPDVAVAMSGLSGGDGKVDLQINAGGGRFTDHPFPVAFRPQALTLADWSGDGLNDLLVSESSSGQNLHLFHARQPGTFSFQASFESKGSYPAGTAAGDFNADGFPDLAVVDATGAGVSVLLGLAGGGFAPASLVPDSSRWRATKMPAVDFDGDGTTDLITPQGALRGKGDGSFSRVASFGGTRSVAIADFNRDGRLDVASATGDAIQIWQGAADAQAPFAYVRQVSAAGLSGLGAGDFNQDGHPDLVYTLQGEGAVRLLTGDGGGDFGVPESVGACIEPGVVAVADVNGDGREDVLVGCRGLGETAQLAVLLQGPSPPPLPMLRFEADHSSVAESANEAVVWVVRGDAATEGRVDYATRAGLAAAGEDYGEVTGSLIFAAGVLRLSITVPILDDGVFEGPEDFSIELLNPQQATLAQPTISVTILDDEPAPPEGWVRLTGSTLSVSEGDLAAAVVVVREGGSGELRIDFATEDGSATGGADYERMSGVLSFVGSPQEQTITIPIVDDDTPEPLERFSLRLTPEGSVVGPAVATVDVVDDDPTPSTSSGGGGCSLAANADPDHSLALLSLVLFSTLLIRHKR